METPPRSPAPMAAYLRRYERQQRERRLERQQRRAEQPEAAAQDLSGFLSEAQQDGEPRGYDDEFSARQQADDEFAFAELRGGPLSAEQQQRQQDEEDEEFVDAATFLARDDRDSFLQEEGVTEWQSENENGRPSDFFQRKSRSLERVDFALTEREDVVTAEPPVNKYDDPTALRHHRDRPASDKNEINSPRGVDAQLSESQATAVSSSDIHFDSARLAYTPNSLKYMQDKQRFKSRQTLQSSSSSIADYSGEALKISQDAKYARSEFARGEESDTPSEGTMTALHRGPAVIRNALSEIDALLNQSRRRSATAPRNRRNILTPRDFQELVREYDINQDTGLPMSRTTDSWEDEASDDQARPVGSIAHDTFHAQGDIAPRELDTICELPSYHDEDFPAQVPVPELDELPATHRDVMFRLPPRREDPPESVDTPNIVDEAVQERTLTPHKPLRDRHVPSAHMDDGLGRLSSKDIDSDKLVKTLQKNNVRVAMDPVRLSRRCRRLLCNVGDVVTEQVIFSNGTDSMGRLCVSLLPLSTGCQQFSVAPAVLELAPQTSGAFHVTFNAKQGGVAAGIFQFRGVGVDSLFRPYEVLMEASVRRTAKLEEHASSSSMHVSASRNVEELRDSVSIKDVDIGPTFIQFDSKKNADGELVVRQSKIRVVNNTAEALPFKVKCAHENLKIQPTSGVLTPASEMFISLLPVSQPFRHIDPNELTAKPITDKWCGSLSIRVGEHHAREISVVVSAALLSQLPLFDEVARSRHHISSQTDSFYYTKRRNRRGLYFHARAVECGSCLVGDSHEVPVYVCNGSNRPMTVFMQDLQEPFSCAYSTTTIQPRKFIEVPVRFTPKVVGKVSTSLFAYSVDQKAVLTLVARGI